LVFDTRPLTGVVKIDVFDSGGRSLRSDHRLPSVTPTGVVITASPPLKSRDIGVSETICHVHFATTKRR
jgi:hypothetical protein